MATAIVSLGFWALNAAGGAQAQTPRLPGLLGDIFNSCGNPYGCGNRTYGTGSQAVHPGDPPCSNPYGCAHGQAQGGGGGAPGRFYGGASPDVYCQQSPGQPMYGPYRGTGTNTPCGPAFAPRAQQPPRPPPARGGCVVYDVNGVPVWSKRASNPGLESGILLAQYPLQGSVEEKCGDNPAPARQLTQFELKAQITDEECAWYYRVTEAIAKHWRQYISNPDYTTPPTGTKVTVDYVIYGKPAYTRGGLTWGGWWVSDDKGGLNGLGFSWDAGMTRNDRQNLQNFASRALADVDNDQARAEKAGKDGPLTLLPGWQKEPFPAPRVIQGKPVYFGIHLQSTFSVTEGGPQHSYNVACIDWIRRNKDQYANPLEGSTPFVFVMR